MDWICICGTENDYKRYKCISCNIIDRKNFDVFFKNKLFLFFIILFLSFNLIFPYFFFFHRCFSIFSSFLNKIYIKTRLKNGVCIEFSKKKGLGFIKPLGDRDKKYLKIINRNIWSSDNLLHDNEKVFKKSFF